VTLNYNVNFSNYVVRNEEVENPTIAVDDAGQLLQLHVGNQADIVRPHNSGNTVDITGPSETADSDHNEVNSADHVQLISSKEDILNELALLYIRKRLSLSALGAIAKLIVALEMNEHMNKLTSEKVLIA
jgi:hypothetical protein